MVVMDCRRRLAAPPTESPCSFEARGTPSEWSQWSGAHSVMCCVPPKTRWRAPSTPAATAGPGVDLCGKARNERFVKVLYGCHLGLAINPPNTSTGTNDLFTSHLCMLSARERRGCHCQARALVPPFFLFSHSAMSLTRVALTGFAQSPRPRARAATQLHPRGITSDADDRRAGRWQERRRERGAHSWLLAHGGSAGGAADVSDYCRVRPTERKSSSFCCSAFALKHVGHLLVQLKDP
eukprot:5264432-Prymnesium_polylepis.1